MANVGREAKFRVFWRPKPADWTPCVDAKFLLLWLYLNCADITNSFKEKFAIHQHQSAPKASSQKERSEQLRWTPGVEDRSDKIICHTWPRPSWALVGEFSVVRGWESPENHGKFVSEIGCPFYSWGYVQRFCKIRAIWTDSFWGKLG